MNDNKAKILVVDDELGPRESLRMILKDRYEVTTVDNGVAAIEHINLNPVDLVLLDIRMPGMDGIETLKKIKEISPETEVVLITAYASVDTAQEAVRYDAVDYLIKPFSRVDVNAVVEKGLSRRREHLEFSYELKTLQDQMRALTLTSSQVPSQRELIPALSTIGEQAARALRADAYAVYSFPLAFEKKESPVEPLCGELVRELTTDAAKAIWGIITGERSSSLVPQVISLSDPGASAVEQNQGDVSPARPLREFMAQRGYRVMLLLPLRYMKRLLGAMAFSYQGSIFPADREMELAQTFAYQAAAVLQTNRLYEKLRSRAAELTQKVAQLSIVREISAAMLSNLDLDAVFDSITTGLKRLGYTEVNIRSVLDEKKQSRRGEPASSLADFSSEAIPKAIEYEWEEGRREFKITAPIVVDEQPVYLLEVYAQKEPNGKEIELMGMVTEQIAIAIKNSQLYRENSETKGYLESLIQNAGDAIITMDLNDEITSWNKAAERVFQYSPGEIIGQNIGNLLSTSEYKENRELMLSSQKPRSFETRGQRSDGAPIDINVTIAPIKDADQEVIGISAIIQDVTEQKRLQSQLVHSEKQRALGVMSSGIAHNFNNILAGILGHAQLLQMRTPKTEEYRQVHKTLKIIEEAALEGAAVIKRMQKFSHTDGRENFKPVNLNEVVETSLSLSEPKWKREPESKGVKITVNKQLGNIPFIEGDASQLSEVLVNLIFNAVEAMPNGGEISIKTGVGKNNHVYLSVADTGIGMTPEVKEKIFDPFFSTKGAKGVGLGMSVVYGILKSHRAQIDINSTLGKGTEFIIKFPLPHEKIKEQPQGYKTATYKVSSGKILFIEDEKNVRELFAEMAETTGHQIKLASSGTEGLQILQNSPEEFDVLFTDLLMPDMNGWQVAEKAKQIAPSLSIIVGSGWNIALSYNPKDHPEVDFVIPKPYEINKLLEVLDKAIKLKQRRIEEKSAEDFSPL